MNKPRTSIAAIMFAALLPAAVLAASRTWTGEAGDGDWSNTGNWSGSTLPGSADTASFTEGEWTVTAKTVDSVAFGKLSLAENAKLKLGEGTFVLNGAVSAKASSKLTLASGATLQYGATASAAFPCPIECQTGSTFDYSGSSKLTFNSGFASDAADLKCFKALEAGAGSVVAIRGGSLEFGPNGYIVVGENAKASFANLENGLTLAGAASGSNGSLNMSNAGGELVLENTSCTVTKALTLTGAGARIVLSGSANLALSDAATMAFGTKVSEAVDPASGVTFVLPATASANAPIAKSVSQAKYFNFYATTAIELDITEIGDSACEYALVQDPTDNAKVGGFANAIADAGSEELWLQGLSSGLKLTKNGYEVADRTATLSLTGAGVLVVSISSGSGKTQVEIPTIDPTETVYTGEEQKPDVAADEGKVTLVWQEDEGAWTNAGVWTVTAVLKDTDRCEWADGTTGPRELEFTIARAENSWTELPSLGLRVFRSGDGTTVNCGAAAFGDVEPSYTEDELKALAPGAYEIAFTVAKTENWSGLQTNITFAVRDASIPQPGDPDTSATDYTWTGGVAGVWYDLRNWTSLTSPCFGYPDSTEITSAKFTETAVVDGDTVYSSKVQALILPRDGEFTLNAGNFEIGGQIVIPSGETVKLTIGRETSVTAAYSGNDQISIGGDTEVTVGVRGSLTLENATYLFSNGTKATLEVDGGTYSSTRYLSHGGETARLIARNGAEVTLSNPTFGETSFADSTLSCGIATIDAGKTLAATGSVVTIDELRMDGEGSAARFEDSAALAIAEVDFAKKNAVTNAVVEFKSVETTVTNVYFGGDIKYAVANARLVVDEAQLTVAEKLTIRDLASGCRIEFRGENPKFDLAKSYPCVFGKAGGETLENPNGLAFCLPSRPYASAPFVKEAGTGTDKGLSLYGNAALALDVANACEGERYPLVCDKVGKFSVGIEDAGGEAAYLERLAAGLKVSKGDHGSHCLVTLTIEDDTLFATVKSQGLAIMVK